MTCVNRNGKFKRHSCSDEWCAPIFHVFNEKKKNLNFISGKYHYKSVHAYLNLFCKMRTLNEHERHTSKPFALFNRIKKRRKWQKRCKRDRNVQKDSDKEESMWEGKITSLYQAWQKKQLYTISMCTIPKWDTKFCCNK